MKSNADTNDEMSNGVSKTKLILLPPRDGIDFEALPWNLNCPESHKYIHVKTTSGAWETKHYDPSKDEGDVCTSVLSYSSSPLGLSPATTSLNYGTTVWEGLKCFRTSKGRAAVFRPQKNFERFCNGAEALCLPKPSYELFMRGIQTAVQENSDLIPPFGEGMKLYIRPILMGSGQQLGLYPSPEMSLIFYVSPTGNYFKGKAAGGLKLHLETKHCRAARGGMGSVKCSGNYAATLRPLEKAKAQGFNDNLYMELDTYTDGKLEDSIVQELSAANVFVVLKTGEIITPTLDRGTILPGVTRDSVVALVKGCVDELQAVMVESTGDADVKVSVSERDVQVKDFLNATEAFVTGTAAEIVPIASLATGEGEESFDVVLPHGANLPGGPVTAKLLEMLREIMSETRTADWAADWLPDPFATAGVFRQEDVLKRKFDKLESE
mmetsp:Transcript_16913/g.24807  ORF Transcript_16913/g.24807 Transcript_16913/m.24807 type:complete len:438 (+) Transcript_16913:34-1347(+)